VDNKKRGRDGLELLIVKRGAFYGFNLIYSNGGSGMYMTANLPSYLLKTEAYNFVKIPFAFFSHVK
jgi:hypothetical protein